MTSDEREASMPLQARVRAHEHVLAVGVDTASIAAAATALERFGERYVRRVCSPDERRSLPAGAARPPALARLWAAKEAATKTLAPAATEPWPWPDVEIRDDGVRLHGGAARLASRAGIERLLLADRIAEPGHPDLITVLALALGDAPTDEGRIDR